MAEPKYRIGVIGASRCSEQVAKISEQVGQEIARRGAILVCGGLAGVMEAAAKGAKSQGGTTIGILPGDDPKQANPYIDIPIVTGIGFARNIIVVKTSDVVIAVDGSYGTLSEIAYCLNLGVPLVGLSTWEVDDSIVQAHDPREAVDLAFGLIKR